MPVLHVESVELQEWKCAPPRSRTRDSVAVMLMSNVMRWSSSPSSRSLIINYWAAGRLAAWRSLTAVHQHDVLCSDHRDYSFSRKRLMADGLKVEVQGDSWYARKVMSGNVLV